MFMTFYTSLILLFSLIWDIMNTQEVPIYRKIGLFSGNILATLRLSMGDSDFNCLYDETLNQAQHYLFWITWVVMTIFSALIFLNFIIAEVCNSYAKVRFNIQSLMYKEKAGLINEAEDILTDNIKNNKVKFPKYMISRQDIDTAWNQYI